MKVAILEFDDMHPHYYMFAAVTASMMKDRMEVLTEVQMTHIVEVIAKPVMIVAETSSILPNRSWQEHTVARHTGCAAARRNAKQRRRRR